MKKKTKKITFSVIGLVIVIAIALTVMQNGKEKATVVQADLVILDSLYEVVSVSGRLEPQTKVNITSQVSAEIMSILVKEGDVVTKGQTLIQLDTVQLNATMLQAKYAREEVSARADASKSQYNRDDLEYERQKKLYDQKLTSETAYTDAKFAAEKSKANYMASKAQLKTSKAGLEKALDNLNRTRITAPMDGVVTFLSAEVGEIAQAQTSFTQGKTLMTISDLSSFEVQVEVDETEISKIEIGQKTSIKVDAFRGVLFDGTVIEIGNSAKVTGQGTENYSTNFAVKVLFEDDNPKIRPGMSATVDIITATTDEAVLVPYAAIVTREFSTEEEKTEASTEQKSGEVFAAENNEDAEVADESISKKKKRKKEKLTGVFVIRDGKAIFIEIETGIADERNIVALNGLTPGDTVISGSFKTIRKLEKGELVKIDERSIEKMKEEE